MSEYSGRRPGINGSGRACLARGAAPPPPFPHPPAQGDPEKGRAFAVFAAAARSALRLIFAFSGLHPFGRVAGPAHAFAGLRVNGS
eukprot:281531-Chlamydomonas_euryale.AAC.1